MNTYILSDWNMIGGKAKNRSRTTDLFYSSCKQFFPLHQPLFFSVEGNKENKNTACPFIKKPESP